MWFLDPTCEAICEEYEGFLMDIEFPDLGCGGSRMGDEGLPDGMTRSLITDKGVL